MATVNKNFKIKSGLIVEGTTATVNSYDILTKKPADDQYIIDLIGGETLVKSVSNEFDVSGAGELSIDRATVDAYYDAAGDAAAAQAAAATYTDNRETAITTAYESYADQAEVDAKAYTDTREGLITTAYEAYADQAEVDAKAYTDTREGLITTAYEAYADQAESDAVTTANAYTNAEITTALSTAQGYADTAEADAVTTANSYTDTAVANLVDSAPELLDTLNELAAAIGNDENFAANLATSVGEKVAKAGDTMTGLLVLSADPSANLGAATKQYVDTAETDAVTTANGYTDTREGLITTAYQTYADQAETDAVETAQSYTNAEITTALSTAQGYADTAEAAAIAHADALDTDDVAEGSAQYFTDARAKSSAADLLTGATLSNITITGNGAGLTITAENGVADSDTDDLAEGSTNLYFTDLRAQDALFMTNVTFDTVSIHSVAWQMAATQTCPTAGIQIAHDFPHETFRSAEYLVKVAYGTHTEVSKVLLTLDASNNIAITEYGIVGTDGSASSISADVSGDNVRLLVTTANNDSTVTVIGTLLV